MLLLLLILILLPLYDAMCQFGYGCNIDFDNLQPVLASLVTFLIQIYVCLLATYINTNICTCVHWGIHFRQAVAVQPDTLSNAVCRLSWPVDRMSGWHSVCVHLFRGWRCLLCLIFHSPQSFCCNCLISVVARLFALAMARCESWSSMTHLLTRKSVKQQQTEYKRYCRRKFGWRSCLKYMLEKNTFSC